MKLALIQKDINNSDWVGLLQQAADLKPDLACLGELALSGCLYNGGEGMPLQDVTARLDRFDFPVMLGFPQATETGLRNAFLYYSRGRWQVYHKINLFAPMNEDRVYHPGDTPGLFNTELGELGVAICFDLRFPEVFTDLAAGGAEKIFVPAAWPKVRIDDWRRILVERANETKRPVIGINAVGDDGTNQFGGSTMAVAADGTILFQADETSEAVFEVTI